MAAVEAFCASRTPPEVRDEIRVECSRRGNSISIVERRPPWSPESEPEWTAVLIAQLRLDPKSPRWSLHWRDSSERWHRYEDLEPTETIDPLLAEIDADPLGPSGVDPAEIPSVPISPVGGQV